MAHRLSTDSTLVKKRFLTHFPLCLFRCRLVAEYVAHHNEVRLHSVIGNITPAAKLAGRDPLIFAQRNRMLEGARERRRAACEASRPTIGTRRDDCLTRPAAVR